MAQYADQLSAGHQAMLKTYPSFYMNIYPTHRSASSPQRIYEATHKVAATAELVNQGNSFEALVGNLLPPLASVRGAG